ncbi:hypothetical protein [Limnobaculum xujianqingii]|uniref:hypothetical protein n=1 Tax=Limnobaculum xujianqingii TaxID=2738837 RepID=UPI0015E80F5E|nr:hypothetical protein [Limnobaculum xujianqingii]
MAYAKSTPTAASPSDGLWLKDKDKDKNIQGNTLNTKQSFDLFLWTFKSTGIQLTTERG